MAINVDWPNKVIYVYKADMTLVQSSPTIIYSLDLNQFRLTLKDLEDDEEGMPWPDTHSHSPPVEVGGVTLARVVEIINDYTVTFEDGQYAVNLSGANSNVGDRVNVNQVSIRSANSAGLVTSAAIEFGEYGGGVTIDIDNITGNATSGSVYPIGTLRAPCNNIDDALVIAEARGFNTLYILGDAIFTSSHDIDGFIIKGQSSIQNSVLLEAGAQCYNSVFKDLEVTGTLDGGNELSDCIIGDLTYFYGHILNCGLMGEITLSGGGSSVISDCKTIDPFSPPSVDLGGSGQDLAMPNFSGNITLKNLTGESNFAGVGLLGGTVTLDSSVVAGTVQVSGVGELIDINGNNIDSQSSWNGGVEVTNHTVTEDNIVDKVWDTQLSEHTDDGSAGKALSTASSGGVDYDSLKDAVWNADLDAYSDSESAGAHIKDIKSDTERLRDISEGNWEIIGTQMIFYDTDSNEIMRFNLKDSDGLPSNDEVFSRERV